MLEGIQIHDFDWKYIYVNDALVNYSTYSREKLLGFTIMEKYPGIEQTELFKVMDRCLKERVTENLKTEFTFPNGTKGDFELRIQPIPEGILILSLDITESKKTEENLKKSEKLFRSIALNIPKSLVILMDKDHRFIKIEGDLMERLGYERQDYEGKHPLEVSPKERYEASKPLYERVFKGEKFSMEQNSPLGDFIVHFVPMTDASGSVESAMIMALDVSDIKKAQNEIIELNKDLEKRVSERTAQLEAVNKELGAFSYSVSHDLRAPIRAINGYAKILEEDYAGKLDAEGTGTLHDIVHYSEQMGLLIDDLLAFSQLGRKEIVVSEINMTALVKSIKEELMFEEGGNRIEFKVNALPSAKGDPSLIKQVWINLISNAIKYSKNNTNPVVEIGAYEKDNLVIYSVRDNGVGFDMQYYDKLYGVFQRLHSQEEFEGTGIGLAIVQKIVFRHNGTVWAESTVNEGACFNFSLPILNS